MNRKKVRFCLLVASAAVGLCGKTAFGESVVLWNRLGSDSEVTNSEIGPNGAIVGAGRYAYEAARFGLGYIKTYEDSSVKFPDTIWDGLRQRGAAALWINSKVPHPVPFLYGVFGLIDCGGALPWTGSNIFIGWGDGVTGRGIFAGVHFDGYNDLVRTNDEPRQFKATPGVPFHVAVVWDIDGIDGTTDTVRAYRDGVIVGRASGRWNTLGTALTNRFRLGTGPDAEAADKFISDNIVVWDYAKTDFSDRFNENPIGKSFSNFAPRAEFTLGPKANDDSYWIRGWLKLADTSNGINPLTEAVTVKVGPISHTLPAGSFLQDGSAYSFKGPVGPSTLEVRITPSSTPGGYSFKSCLKNGSLEATTMEPQIQLTIGDDQGQATLDVGYAKFGKGKGGQNWVFPPAK